MTSQLTMAIPLTEKRSWMQLLAQCAIGSAAIAVTTFVAFRLHFPLATAGFIYLLVVVVVSLLYGIWQATFISLVAVSCLNYFFIPPVLSFAVADERDWIALVSFQVCALLVSRLSSREQRMARDANYQRIQMKKLYELSRGILLFDLHRPPGPQLVQLIRRIFVADDVAIFDANLARLDHEGMWPPEEQEIAKTAYITDKNEDDREFRTTQRVIRIGTVSIGAMAIRGEIDPLIANSIASLAAIAFERHRSYEKEAKAESAKQAEQLRVAVLDALAHAFKTPLTVICTASSGLLEMGTLDKTEQELADLINEESINLNQLCTRLLQTAKLEASNVTLRTEPVIVSKLVKDVVSNLSGTLKGHPIKLSLEEQDTPLQGDRELLTMILTQYLDNAAKYSTPESPIDIAVRESSSELLLSVRNVGSLIQMQDRERVFERFYRGASAKERAPGTGVGLSIVNKSCRGPQGTCVGHQRRRRRNYFLSVDAKTSSGRMLDMEAGLILVVDDEMSIRRALHTTLYKLGFKTVEAARGEEALSLVRSNTFDAVLLDINMPGMTGIETCRNMRRLFPRIPILMLTVRDSEDDKVEALDAGADDYITKPFQLRELTARIRAAMRWAKAPFSQQDESVPVLHVGDIELDPVRRTVKKANRPIHLTPKEFELTHQLMSYAGRPIPHSRLLNSVWGPEYGGELEYLRTFMHQLRKKLEDDPANPRYLLTDAHVGYRFVEKL